MKPKLKFDCRKVAIITEKEEVTYYYADLMYATYIAPYWWLHFCDGSKHKAEISLEKLLENLPEKPFVKIHRTVLINLCYFSKCIEDEKGACTVIMEDKSKHPLSYRNKKNFKKKKGNMITHSHPCPKCATCKMVNCKNFWLFCKQSEWVACITGTQKPSRM